MELPSGLKAMFALSLPTRKMISPSDHDPMIYVSIENGEILKMEQCYCKWLYSE
jgi:hypothetical protein